MLDRMTLLMDDDKPVRVVADPNIDVNFAGTEHSIQVNGGVITVYNIKAKDRRSEGTLIPGHIEVGHHANVEEGKSIELFGSESNRLKGATPYRNVFKVGDYAEYDSYNLSYTGVITGITQKSVTIQPGRGEKKRRLSLYEFSWRNRLFDLEETRRRNSETMMHI